MRHLRLTVLGFAVVAVAAACGASGSSSPSSASTVASPAAQSVAPASSPAPSTAVASDPLPIALTEWSVTVPTTIKAGSTTFAITNGGTAPHELLMFKSELAPAAYPVDAAGDILEDGAGVALVSDGENIDPGGTQARTVDLVPGTYLFVCNIPGHFKQGMATVVTVTP